MSVFLVQGASEDVEALRQVFGDSGEIPKQKDADDHDHKDLSNSNAHGIDAHHATRLFLECFWKNSPEKAVSYRWIHSRANASLIAPPRLLNPLVLQKPMKRSHPMQPLRSQLA